MEDGVGNHSRRNVPSVATSLKISYDCIKQTFWHNLCVTKYSRNLTVLIIYQIFIAALHAASASGAPQLRKFGYLSIPEILVVHPPARTSAPQENQCEMLHFLASVGACNWYCKSMLSLIDSCRSKVSTDQYHLTVSQAQVSTHRAYVFFEVVSDKLAVFN